MEVKRKVIFLDSKKSNRGYHTKLILHWDKDLKEYVLCKNGIFKYIHFSLEEVEDMLRILKRENKVK